MPRLSKIGAAALGAFGWTSGSAAVTVDFLVIAGGGGGGSAFGGGGGAGGYRCSVTGESSGGGASAEGKLSLVPTQSYTVTVGGGGPGSTGNGTNGSNSVFSTITSTGGGYGGGAAAGGSGGSGGGAGSYGGAPTFAAAAGTANQGFAGGQNTGSANYGTGGGGGAGAVGGTGTTTVVGSGGTGVSSSITGSSVGRAGGGGGAGGVGFITTPGTASDGGGAGGSGGSAGNAGTANTGGGGGAGSYSGSTWASGGQGGSGVVIISYVGAQQFGGGIVTSSGGNTIHTFTTSGTLSPLNSLTANFLVVAGGAGGGEYWSGGGGGAGGLRSSVTNTGGGGTLESALTIDTNSIYLVTVGAGGAGAATGGSGTKGANGSNSAFLSIASTGGGAGGLYNNFNGNSGGSGGGGFYGGTGGAGTANQGRAGGAGASSGFGNESGGGGGGGAGTAGAAGAYAQGGNGGNGVAVAISGTSVTYAGGGGGSVYTGTGGTGGSGGGADGVANGGGNGKNGTANTGGGASGTATSTLIGGNGGSGIVIISYPGSTQQMAGGTVTVAGGNVIHTFTSSGYLTPIVLVNNSLRFRSSASAYLNRTPTNVATSRRIMTYSAWVKLGILGTQRLLYEGYTSVSDLEYFMFNSSNQLEWSGQVNGGTSYGVRTPAVFRDPSAWYHVVIAIDTTQATDTNRIKIYVNGVQQTGLTTFYSGFPAQNTDLEWNNQSSTQVIGWGGHTGYYDGYMADINMVDGQALTPNSFGTSNGLGVWQPIRYGGSYGTNGFYLPFTSGDSTFIGSYNGSSAFFNAANNAAFAFGTGSLTVEAWVYPTQNSYGAIFDTRSSGSGGPGMSIYANSGNGIILVNNTTYNPSTYLSLNQWSHIAAVRNGASAWTVYINGISVLTFTDASNLTDNACFSGKNYAGTFFFGGAISNLRVVKGTAVYTSNFTLPTSPLTNISGTSLLTLQNSTLIDNSTNAFSLTNTGPVTLGTSYPFSAARIFNDQSPQGNNWTPNNFSGASGSTLDYMTDVPTLTSATAANYAVLNPLANPVGTLSNGNLQINTTTDQKVTTATMALPSTGQYYFEITATDYVFDGGVSLGLVNSPFLTTFPANGTYIGMGTYSGNYNNGTTSDNTNLTGTNVTQDGDIWCFAIDVTNNKFWAGRSRSGTLVWADGVTPSVNGSGASTLSLPTGNLYPMIYRGGSFNEIYNFNFGQQPFAHTPPTGFNRLNTFNLPTPTIGATASTTANKYFNPVLYTGNNGTQTVSGVGFQPDLVWIKNRGAGNNNVLNDVLRGAGYTLYSDDTYPEGNLTSYFTGFNSDGFSLALGGGAFNAVYNYVSWNWKANGAGVSNTAGSINSTVSSNPTAGFSIVTYTGNSTNGATVGHGLLVGGVATAPSMVIIKVRNATARWVVYQKDAITANNQFLSLDATTGVDTSGTNFWTIASINNTTFGLGTNADTNGSTLNFVAYCFAPIAGYSAFGTYTGNNDTNGPFVYLGFRPRYIMIKSLVETSNWFVYDTARSPYNQMDILLFPSDVQGDYTDSTYAIDAVSNGFKIRGLGQYGGYNNSGNGYIYMAFAENPFKYANAR